jgi:hypothetical protein
MDPSSYPPRIADLLSPERLNPLEAGVPNEEARAALQALTVREAFAPQTVHDEDMARACLAGLWLYHDFLDESHCISQEIETPSGSYWHGLLHRREGDFGNSKYWFRRVGAHPVFAPLCRAAAELAGPDPERAARFLATQETWDPFAFIDLCAAAVAGRVGCKGLCRRIQQAEWNLLFASCYRACTSSNSG